MPAIRKFIRERSKNFSAAKLLQFLKENNSGGDQKSTSDVKEFSLLELRVIVKLKNPEDHEKEKGKAVDTEAMKGRISFISWKLGLYLLFYP